MPVLSAAMPIMLLVVFVDLVGFGIVIPLLPFFAKRFAASPFEVTAMLSMYSLLQLVSAPLWGRFSDRNGRKPALYASIIASIISYRWMSHADALWMLFAARALQGASAGNISVCQAYIADVTSPQTRARGMAAMGGAFGLGFMCGPFIGGVLAGPHPTSFSVSLPGYAAALFSALALVIAVFSLKESFPPERRAALRPPIGRFAQIGEAFSRPRLRILMALFFATTFAFAGMETTFGLWGHDRMHWGPQQVGYMFGFVGATLVVMQSGVVRRLAKTIPEERLLISGLVLITIGLFLLAIAASLPIALLANFLLASGIATTSPMITSLVSREADEMEQGVILGVNQSVGSFARVTGPALAGLAYTVGGSALPYFLGAAIMLAPIWLAMGLVRDRVPA